MEEERENPIRNGSDLVKRNEKGQFLPGSIPNPNGRGAGVRDYATIYREALRKIAEKNNMKPDDFEAEMIANGLLLGRKGDYRFYKDVLDRNYGQATQKHEGSDVMKVLILDKEEAELYGISSRKTENGSEGQD